MIFTEVKKFRLADRIHTVLPCGKTAPRKSKIHTQHSTAYFVKAHDFLAFESRGIGKIKKHLGAPAIKQYG